VGLWNSTGDLNDAKERIGSDPRTKIVATLAAAQEQIRRFVESESEQRAQPDGEKVVVAGRE